MIPFVTLGGMRIDYLITHQGEARLGLLGGNALYAAVGAALWGVDVGLWSRVGENFPDEQLQLLKQSQIHAQNLVPVPGRQDHRTFFAYSPDGQRDDTNPAAHFARIGQPLPAALKGYIHSTLHQANPAMYEPLAVQPADWPAAFQGATAVHLSPLSLATHLNVPPFLRNRQVGQITLDPGERYMVPAYKAHVKRFLPSIDVFLPSTQEVRSLFGKEIDFLKAAERLASWGVETVVIKNGAAGVIVYQQQPGRVTTIPAFHQRGSKKVVDITGAGDSFCGGFMVGLARTQDPVQAALLGSVSASFVIEGYGALYAAAVSPAAANKRLEKMKALVE